MTITLGCTAFTSLGVHTMLDGVFIVPPNLQENKQNWRDHRLSHAATCPVVSGKTEPGADRWAGVLRPQQTPLQLPKPHVLQAPV